jgi:hypothetical protein
MFEILRSKMHRIAQLPGVQPVEGKQSGHIVGSAVGNWEISPDIVYQEHHGPNDEGRQGKKQNVRSVHHRIGFKFGIEIRWQLSDGRIRPDDVRSQDLASRAARSQGLAARTQSMDELSHYAASKLVSLKAGPFTLSSSLARSRHPLV